MQNDALSLIAALLGRIRQLNAAKQRMQALSNYAIVMSLLADSIIILF